MIRVCVLGNSFIGAVKLAWAEMAASQAEVQLDFFGSTGVSLQTLQVEDGRLVSASPEVRKWFKFTSSGQDEIELATYDSFVVVGLTLAPYRVALACERHRPLRLARPGLHLISSACFRDSIRGATAATLAVQVGKKIRSATDAPVFLVPMPQPSIAVVDEPQYAQHAFTDHEMIAAAYPYYMEALADISEQERLIVIPQPESTLTDYNYTKPEYAGEAISLTGAAKRKPDLLHMGRSYGHAVLRDLIPAVQEQSFGEQRSRGFG